MMEHSLKVEALKNGTAIDHIPAGQARRILKLFRLSESGERVYIGFNLPSQQFGKKDLIKVENIQLSPEQANQLALFAPHATVNVIENFQVIAKHRLGLPESISGALTCPNSNCITHVEPIETTFRVLEVKGEVRLKCRYCEKAYGRDAFAQLA